MCVYNFRFVVSVAFITRFLRFPPCVVAIIKTNNRFKINSNDNNSSRSFAEIKYKQHGDLFNDS